MLNDIFLRDDPDECDEDDVGLLDQTEQGELDSFVKELGLYYSKLWNATHRGYLHTHDGFIYLTREEDGGDDMFWTWTYDGCIENMATGKTSESALS
jgi:hypothetical protein